MTEKKPYDVTTKDLLKRDPASWMVYCRLPGGPIEVFGTDVSTVTADTDQVYRVGGPGAHLVHIEMQSRRQSNLARRLWRYSALLDLKYNLRVRSVAVLLRPEADSRKLNGVLELRLPDKDRVVIFYYRVIRAWEQPVEPLLTGSMATLPMAPLADVSLAELPRILERIDSRLIEEAAPPDAARIMASALTLAGMRLGRDEIMTLGKRLRTMNILKDSSFYHAIVEEGLEIGRQQGRQEGRQQGRQEGRQQGRQEGRQEGWQEGRQEGWQEGLELGQHNGRIAEAREVLFRLGRIRFGRLNKATRATIEAIDNLGRLEMLSERLLTATSWADLLAELD